MYENSQRISSPKRPGMLGSNETKTPAITSYKSTSSSSGGSGPATPRMYGSLQIMPNKCGTGYDSDSSSEEKRWSHRRIGLRITNPDKDNAVIQEKQQTLSTETLPIVAPVTPNSNETQTIAMANKPALPPHQFYADPLLVRRESRTLADYDEEQSTQASVHDTDDMSELSTPIITSAQIAASNPSTSKYAKVSYHLTNDPNAIKRYRKMAEKTNDTTTQLMFAKYLLETAVAFYASNDPNRPPQVVGSMWGVSTTSKKTQQPDPVFVVQPDGSSASRQSVTEKAETVVTSITMKQQVSLVDKRTSMQVVDPTRVARRKALEEEGVRWVKKLAKINVGEACFMLANWMDKELYGFKSNTTKSIQMHTIAARSNIPESLFAIAHYFDRAGEGMEPAKILKYYRISAEQGYVNAIYAMAFIKIKGRLGVRQSLTEGLNLMYQACTLCSEEFNQPLYVFAQMLTNDFSELDIPEPLITPYGGREAAILYYERAAKLNNALAQSKLGSIYEHGLYGESMNFAKAFEYYEVAAFNNDAKAMLGLCRLNNRGSHGPGDKNEEYRLRSDVSGWLASTPVNEDLSFSWCEKAAKEGLPDALSLLGWFYEIGFGVPRDFEKATFYYQLAVEKGDFGAKTRLTNTNKSITKQQHEEISASASRPKEKNTCFCM